MTPERSGQKADGKGGERGNRESLKMKVVMTGFQERKKKQQQTNRVKDEAGIFKGRRKENEADEKSRIQE